MQTPPNIHYYAKLVLLAMHTRWITQPFKDLLSASFGHVCMSHMLPLQHLLTSDISLGGIANYIVC